MVRVTNRFLISSKMFVKETYGQEVWNTLMETLQPATRNIFKAKINPKKDVGFDKVADLLVCVEKLLAKEHPDVLFELGLHNSADDLSATQKLFMKIISVEWVLKVAAMLWKQRVKNGGKMEIQTLGKGRVKAQIHKFQSPLDQWWRYLSGWFTCAIEFSGGKNVEVKLISASQSPDETTEYEASWS